ncbi:Spo0B domain-containing protein [Bacillus testis]|uniref:Spo0B domain-containing protein n=1 Tax=Bacillus testis TaxID=1622072 RepID=UPI00067EBF8E|nr:Spo0B domain-containing protein [Bacillus testis]
MDKNWGIVDLLSCSRHDWLNKIQLIKGNIELGKMDRVKAVIDQIIMESKNETKLSNCRMPKLAALLLTSNWRGFPFAVEYEVLAAIACTELIDKHMCAWMEAFMMELSSSLNVFDENELKILIDETGQSIRFTFELQGKIKVQEKLASYLDKSPELAALSVDTFTEEMLVFHLDWLK